MYNLPNHLFYLVYCVFIPRKQKFTLPMALSLHCKGKGKGKGRELAIALLTC